MEQMGRCWSQGTKLQLPRMKKSRDAMYSMRIIVLTTVFNAGNLLREQISGALITRKINGSYVKRRGVN